ncbi:polybromo-1 [Drechmeria coniospora]|uniref:Polybromo-1 n=1 Tax=Drechmeria coniospora TaxID=98403 RepID=A0A151GI69_DRECN|nr:polybromo-1 [Drechmeria coniospora]KYK56741.1 polybromo-1 [Drechmeria coniospora]
MDSKRKANGNASSDSDDRLSKRRKMSDFDLSKGESPESTTAYGLAFLEQIRRTADKSGRLVATYFEKLPPRASNEMYYKKTRLPVSLEIVEKKLNDGEFQNLAEVESYCKRMISNAKEFYPRTSTIFDDAERVRKALSNYMTKTNPAYGTRGYQAHPTALPADDDEEAEDEAEEDEKKDEAPEEDDEQGQDEDADGDEEADEDEEESTGRSSRRRSIVLKRRASGRPSRVSLSQAQDSASRPSANSAKVDHQYHKVPYKGLTFQQAQEKIVEELLRYNEPSFEGYFEPFHNLPPRALKDYYKVITDPLSLKKLQKAVKGVQGRGGATGVSSFKSWTAFTERSKLLWSNAYFYNEEGSEIYELAQELENAYYGELEKARAVVQEPAQPKIKLKVAPGSETAASSKKITIHVGGRGSSADSPAPPPVQAVDVDTPAPDANGTMRTSTRVDAAGSVSLSAPSPSPSVQTRSVHAQDSVVASPAPSVQPAQAGQAAQAAPGPQAPAESPEAMRSGLPVQQQAVVPVNAVNGYVEPKRLRRKGHGIHDALISRLRLQLHPSMQVEHLNVMTVLPHPTELQQSATVNLPAHCNRIFIVLTLPNFLYDRQHSLWVMMNRQPLKPTMQPLPGQAPQERAFEVVLHGGVNVLEAHLIAAVPRIEREPGGPETELEIFTVFANVMRT